MEAQTSTVSVYVVLHAIVKLLLATQYTNKEIKPTNNKKSDRSGKYEYHATYQGAGSLSFLLILIVLNELTTRGPRSRILRRSALPSLVMLIISGGQCPPAASLLSYYTNNGTLGQMKCDIILYKIYLIVIHNFVRITNTRVIEQVWTLSLYIVKQ